MSTVVPSTPSPATFAPIRPGSLVASVREQIRTAILSGDVPAGEVLRDSVLATQMGTSRAPVREALRLVEQSGLIIKTANRPYRVVSFSQEDLRELAVLRIAVETTAARIVVAQGRDTSEVHATLTDMRHVWDGSGELDDLDVRFHRALVAASGVDRLTARYDDLIDQIMLAWLRLSEDVPRPADSVAVHERITAGLDDGIRTGDPAAAQQLLIDHIRDGMGCADLVI